ncbi:MAG: cation transporter [Flavobacteriaceae bacterium]
MDEPKVFDLPDPPPPGAGGAELLRPANDAERRVLISSASIAGTLAVMEAVAAILTGSLALMAIAIDSLEDAAHYGLAGYLSGKPKRLFYAALALLAVAAAAGYLWIGWTAFTAFTGKAPPNPWIMMAVAAVSLVVNLITVWRLRALRHEQGEFAFAWAETRWDFVADAGVIVAAMAVSDWVARWPDTIAGLTIAAVNLYGIIRTGIAAYRTLRPE